MLSVGVKLYQIVFDKVTVLFFVLGVLYSFALTFEWQRMVLPLYIKF